MAVPLPGYDSVGNIVLNALSKIDQDDLIKQQVEEEKTKNVFARPKAEEELKRAKQENQLYIPKTQSDIDYKNASTNRLNFQRQNPLYGQPGAAGQIGASELIKQNPKLVSNPDQESQLIMNGLIQSQQSQKATGDLNAKRAAGYDFNSMPVQHKSYMLAQAAGMGVEPNQAVDRFNKGETIDQMAIKEGFDPNNKPEPIYPLTTAGQTALKQRQAANAEVQSLSKTISQWTAPYSRKLYGYSPEQIADALKGEDTEKQAKYLAGRMLYPELSTMRLRAGGANVGIEAIRDLTDTAMGHGKIFQGLVSPKVFNRANELVDESVNNMMEAANKTSTQAIRSKSKPLSSNKNDEVMTYNPKTGRLE